MDECVKKAGCSRVLIFIMLVCLNGCGKHSHQAAVPRGRFGDDEITLEVTPYAEGHSVAWDENKTLVFRADFDSVTLKEFFSILAPGKWLVGAELLPAERFQINVAKLPASPDYLCQHMLKVLEKSFHVKAIQGDRELPRYRFKSTGLPAAFKKATQEHRSAATSEIGWKFEAYSLSDLASWLENDLQVPFDFAGPDDAHAIYDFELPCNIFRPKTVVDSLRTMGFVFEETKLTRPAIFIEKDEAAR